MPVPALATPAFAMPAFAMSAFPSPALPGSVKGMFPSWLCSGSGSVGLLFDIIIPTIGECDMPSPAGVHVDNGHTPELKRALNPQLQSSHGCSGIILFVLCI